MFSTAPDEVRISSKNPSVRGVYTLLHGDLPAGIAGPVYQHRHARGNGKDFDFLYHKDSRWIISPELGGARHICATESLSGDALTDPLKIDRVAAGEAWRKTVLSLEACHSGDLSRLEVHSRFENIAQGLRKKDMEDLLVWANDDGNCWLCYQAESDTWTLAQGSPGTPGAKRLLAKVSGKGTSDPRKAAWGSVTPECPVDGISVVFWDENFESTGMWKDSAFPHTKASLNIEDLGGYKGEVQWIACRDLERDPSHEVLFENISPNDLVQGTIGDCWLMAALACVAEYPWVIEALFTENTRTVPKDGKHPVKLFDIKSKAWKNFEVDEYIPCKKRGWHQLHATPLFSRPRGHDMWVLLLEKAFAKMVGGYHKLKGGQPVFAWQAVTGVWDQVIFARAIEGRWDEYELDVDEQIEEIKKSGRITALPLQQEEGCERLTDSELWTKLYDWSQHAHIMSANIKEQSCDTFSLPNGLVPDHVYSIISMHSTQGMRLVKIRNPHGKGAQWNGAWSETDSQWDTHADLRAELKAYTEQDHATFFMSWEDFMKEFDNIQVCPHKLTRSFAHEMTQLRGGVRGDITQSHLEIAREEEEDERGDRCIDRCAVL